MLSLLLAASLYFSMAPLDNYITEQHSGRNYFVEGVNYAASVEGIEGHALRLDGYSNYVEVDMSKYTLSDSALTISFALAAETYPMMVTDNAQDVWTEVLSTLDEASSCGWAFRLSSQGNYSFLIHVGGSVQACYGSAKFPKQQWNRFVATVDVSAHRLNLYLNGALIKTTPIPAQAINHGANSLMIGKGRSEVKYAGAQLNTFNGIIDELYIDSRVWSDDEIAALPVEAPLNLADRDTIFVNNYYRPRFHAMPAANWTNECHGLVYYNGQYHLFSQKNGNGPYMSRLQWGHYTSADLCHWQEQPIALYTDKAYDMKGCWSGAVFTDEVLTGGEPNIIYTAVNNAKASIALARPADDELITWEKDTQNPIIAGTPAGYQADFRDPYFFRNGDNAYILVGTKKDGVGANTLHRYVGGTWEYVGTFMQGTDAGTCGTFNEMTNVTCMPDGRWLVTATPLDGNNGVRTIYWTGSIAADGTFVRDEHSALPRTFEMEGTSKWGFGLLSPTIYRHGDKVLALGIVPDKLQTYYNVSRLGYAHTMSFPRELSLDAEGNLLQKPYSGLANLRTDEHVSLTDTTLTGAVSLAPISGRQWEVKLREVVGENPFQLEFLKQGYQSAKLKYTPSTGKLLLTLGIDRIANDVNSFNGNYEMQLPATPAVGDTLQLDIYFDNSILEVFVNDRWASSVRIFCNTYNADGLDLVMSEPVRFASVEAWGLGEITHYHPWMTPQRDPRKEEDPSGLLQTEWSDMVEKIFSHGQLLLTTPACTYDVLGRTVR